MFSLYFSVRKDNENYADLESYYQIIDFTM